MQFFPTLEGRQKLSFELFIHYLPESVSNVNWVEVNYSLNFFFNYVLFLIILNLFWANMFADFWKLLLIFNVYYPIYSILRLFYLVLINLQLKVKVVFLCLLPYGEWSFFSPLIAMFLSILSVVYWIMDKNWKAG